MQSDGKRRCEVELPLPVRTYDIDYAGIVSNIVYIRWLEDLRSTILETHFSLKTLMDRGSSPILLRTDIRYIRAIRLFDDLVGHMWVGGMGKARWTLEAEILVDGKIAATAQQEVAVINLETFRPQPVPPEIRKACG